MVDLHPDKGLLSVEEFKDIFKGYPTEWMDRVIKVTVNKESDIIRKMSAIMDKHGFSDESKVLQGIHI